MHLFEEILAHLRVPVIIINQLLVTKEGYKAPMAATSENRTQKAIHRAPPSVSTGTIQEASKSIRKQIKVRRKENYCCPRVV